MKGVVINSNSRKEDSYSLSDYHRWDDSVELYCFMLSKVKTKWCHFQNNKSYKPTSSYYKTIPAAHLEQEGLPRLSE